MTGQYILVDKVPVAEPDLFAWGRWLESAERRVAHTMVGDISISTVFLGLDHNFNQEGPPILFETMVFGGPLDGEMRRYSSWEEAEKGHAEIVHNVETGEKD